MKGTFIVSNKLREIVESKRRQEVDEMLYTKLRDRMLKMDQLIQENTGGINPEGEKQ